MTTVGSNIGQSIVSVALLSTPLPQVSETGGRQATVVVPLVVSVALLSTPLSQVSETGAVVVGVQTSLLVETLVPSVLLSAPMSHVSDAGGEVVVFVFVLASVVLVLVFV